MYQPSTLCHPPKPTFNESQPYVYLAIASNNQDLNPPLYSSYHLSFTSSLPRALLEELASLILQADPTGQTAQLISSVHDQYLDFIVPSPNLFSLVPKRPAQGVDSRPSYVVLNDPKAGEQDIESEVDRVAKGLFSVILTMSKSFNGHELTTDVIPLIRCPRGNAAEMVARKLDAKLRDYIASSRAEVAGLQRPRELIQISRIPAKDSPRYSRPQSRSHPHALSLVDVSGARA